MIELTITRHGETEENQAGVFQGHLPGKLSALGIEQAKRLARRLSKETYDHIYSSDLARAADTTREIAEFHPNTPLTYTVELREIDLGKLQGMKKSELTELIKDPQAFVEGVPEGETFAEFQHRATTFLERIQNTHHNQSILVVCHQNIAKALITTITGKDLSEMNSMGNLTNASISKFELEPDGTCRIVLYNCHHHLD